jgi:uncharacterized membrane protein YkoI
MKIHLFSLQSLAQAAIVGVVLTGAAALHAADADEAALIAQLKQSKLTLAGGIAEAEKQNGSAISAKFEVEDGKFWLSVYTAKSGVTKDAEHNELIELKGEATGAAWKPATEVFEDKKHLTRSAMHLTLLQVSRLSLADVIKKAGATQPGTVYSAIPAVKDANPVFEVKVATPEGKSVTLFIDGKTGEAAK